MKDASQLKLMKRDKPDMKQKGPKAPDVCYPQDHKGRPLSDKDQYKLMKRK